MSLSQAWTWRGKMSLGTLPFLLRTENNIFGEGLLELLWPLPWPDLKNKIWHQGFQQLTTPPPSPFLERGLAKSFWEYGFFLFKTWATHLLTGPCSKHFPAPNSWCLVFFCPHCELGTWTYLPSKSLHGSCSLLYAVSSLPHPYHVPSFVPLKKSSLIFRENSTLVKCLLLLIKDFCEHESLEAWHTWVQSIAHHVFMSYFHKTGNSLFFLNCCPWINLCQKSQGVGCYCFTRWRTIVFAFWSKFQCAF